MASISANASTVVSAGAWLTTTNVYTSDNTYATNTGATQNTEYPLDVGGFNFAGISAGSTINSVTVTIEAKTGTANRAQIKGELYDSTTLLTGTLALTNLTAADANYTFTPTATLAQLQSANLKVRVTNKRIVSQASTTSVDYVKIDVAYTPIPPAITQGAYRFYADGTETGATALAAQDTAPDVDISSGDVNLGVRVRLQETGSGAADATDDWQLQWEKNTSGSWASPASSTVVPHASANLTTLTDSYPESNYSAADSFYSGSAIVERAHSFLGDGRPLSRVGFYLYKSGVPNGTMTAKLYAHDGGTFGGTGLPTGAALATSTTVIDPTTLTTTPTWTYFEFAESVTLSSGTPYFAAMAHNNTGDTSNRIFMGLDNSSAAHAGSGGAFTGVWSSAGTGRDLIFEVYTTNGPTTNRLGAGTGSFVAGKVSRDGLADNVGWSASNYTELLYSVTLKSADLADGDTLRFRVLRNAATTGMTYTAVPTVNIGAGGPTEHTATATLAVTTTATATAVPDKRVATNALAVTTTATAAATRSTFATTTPLAVTTSRTADATATTPGATAPTVVAGFSNNPGTTSTALITATLPAGLQNGDQGLFLVCFNTESATAADPTTQGGWDQIGLDTLGGTNIFTMTLFGTELSAADSGTTVESVLSGSARWACAGIVVRGANPSYDTTALATFSATADTSFPYPSVTPVSANDLLVLLSAHRYTAAVTTGVTHDADWTEYADTATTNTTNPIFGASVAARTLTGQAGVNQTGDTGTTAGASREASWIIAFKGTVGAPTVHEATAALTVTATLTSAATRSTSVTATALAVTTSRTAAATRTTFTTTTALAVTTNRTAAATRATSSATTALAITTTATAAATKASVQTATTTPLAVTTTITTAASRATFATTTALAVTTSRTAAATRTGFATAALAITTNRTAAATRSTFTTTTALAVTTNRTATVTPTVAVTTTALAVTTSRTAAASRQTFTTTTALAVTTSRTAAASRATFATTTALAVTITTTAAAIKTAAGTVAAIPLAVTTSITATATQVLRTGTSSLAVTTSRTAAATHTVLATTTALAVTTSRTATAVPDKRVTTTSLAVTTARTATAVTVPVTLATTAPLTVTTTRTATVTAIRRVGTTQLVVTTTRTAAAATEAAPTDFGHVVLDGALLPVVNRWVIVGGVKKPVVNQSVVYAGEKRPT